MPAPRAFLFDLNGTMVDDMSYHLEVWYDILVNDLGARMSRAHVKQEMYGKSQELLVRIFGKDRFTEAELDRISLRKEQMYQQLYRPHIDLIPGLFSFLEEAYKTDVKMAIGTAAIPYNVDFVLNTLKITHYFETVVSADDVIESKPHPETYLLAAQKMGMRPEECIVFEDAPKGVEAAHNAGMQAVVLTTTHSHDEFKQYPNVILYINDYTSVLPATFVGKRTVVSKNLPPLATILM
jgi:beta-phosphoglucomutase